MFKLATTLLTTGLFLGWTEKSEGQCRTTVIRPPVVMHHRPVPCAPRVIVAPRCGTSPYTYRTYPRYHSYHSYHSYQYIRPRTGLSFNFSFDNRGHGHHRSYRSYRGYSDLPHGNPCGFPSSQTRSYSSWRSR